MTRKEDKWSDILRGLIDHDFLGHFKLIRSPQGDKNYESIEVMFFSVIQTGVVNRVLGHVYLFLLKYGKCVNLKKKLMRLNFI